MNSQTIITPDVWMSLKNSTEARIALGRAGGSIPTHEWLQFKAAHAAARDAVHAPFDPESITTSISNLGLESLSITSAVTDKKTFLLRPDLGRRLDQGSRERLLLIGASASFDLAIIVSDGLSARAAEQSAGPLLNALVPLLVTDNWNLAPLCIAHFGRVALQDEVGELLHTPMVLILLGERPGLSSPESLGAYLVYGPKMGNTDAARNCVSNIRPRGLSCSAAAAKLHELLTASRRLCLSGINLMIENKLE